MKIGIEPARASGGKEIPQPGGKVRHRIGDRSQHTAMFGHQIGERGELRALVDAVGANERACLKLDPTRPCLAQCVSGGLV